PVEQSASREWKPRSGPRRSPTSTICASCCCLGWPASPTRLGATRRSPAGPTTAIASLGTADCGRKTASRTSAPPPWAGSDPDPVRHRRRRAREGLLPVEPDGQLRVEQRIRRPLRAGVRGLQDAEPDAQAERILLPGGRHSKPGDVASEPDRPSRRNKLRDDSHVPGVVPRPAGDVRPSSPCLGPSDPDRGRTPGTTFPCTSQLVTKNTEI